MDGNLNGERGVPAEGEGTGVVVPETRDTQRPGRMNYTFDGDVVVSRQYTYEMFHNESGPITVPLMHRYRERDRYDVRLDFIHTRMFDSRRMEESRTRMAHIKGIIVDLSDGAGIDENTLKVVDVLPCLEEIHFALLRRLEQPLALRFLQGALQRLRAFLTALAKSGNRFEKIKLGMQYISSPALMTPVAALVASQQCPVILEIRGQNVIVNEDIRYFGAHWMDAMSLRSLHIHSDGGVKVNRLWEVWSGLPKGMCPLQELRVARLLPRRTTRLMAYNDADANYSMSSLARATLPGNLLGGITVLELFNLDLMDGAAQALLDVVDNAHDNAVYGRSPFLVTLCCLGGQGVNVRRMMNRLVTELCAGLTSRTTSRDQRPFVASIVKSGYGVDNNKVVSIMDLGHSFLGAIPSTAILERNYGTMSREVGFATNDDRFVYSADVTSRMALETSLHFTWTNLVCPMDEPTHSEIVHPGFAQIATQWSRLGPRQDIPENPDGTGANERPAKRAKRGVEGRF